MCNFASGTANEIVKELQWVLMLQELHCVVSFFSSSSVCFYFASDATVFNYTSAAVLNYS